MLAVYIREIKAYFSSLLAWSLMSAYLLIVGCIVSLSFSDFCQSSLRATQGMMKFSLMNDLVPPLMATFGFLLLFFLPLLTMRLFAEERHSGTLDLLLTYPLTDLQIICGKFFASMSVVVIMLAFTAVGFVCMGHFAPMEWGVIAVGYLGLVLLAGFFVAFGLWTSSLCASQLTAASITYGGLLVGWLFSSIDRDGKLAERFGALSPLEHLNSMVRGTLDTQNLVYFLALIVLFIFLTAMVLSSRKWRG